MTDSDLGLLVAAALAFGYLGLWVWAMVSAANNRQWGWFILVLLFSPVLLVIYLLFGRPRRMVVDNDT